MSRALYEKDVARRILALREDLVRHDENAAAYTLMTQCVPFFLRDHPAILAARERQWRMTRHVVDPAAYAQYYATNVHERPFEEQYPGATVDNAHEVFHRVAFLRRGILEQGRQFNAVDYVEPRILDVSCNDGWMAANLALAGYRCDGIDLNPDCIQRAKTRRGRADLGLMGSFVVGDFVQVAQDDALAAEHDAVVCFETIEHVADPDEAMLALVKMTRLGGRIYISTPNGVDHGGDLSNWDQVEPKGHVRVYTPRSFRALLERYGTVERIEQGPDRVMVAEVTP